MQSNDIAALFKAKDLKLTPQRAAVYKFLTENPVHPDVETIYNRVVKDNPSFSKTTVYNCLQALADRGLIIPVKIDESRIRYDANTVFHGHFICERCGEITDFDCAVENSRLEGFEIRRRDVYYSGLCDRCKNNFNFKE